MNFDFSFLKQMFGGREMLVGRQSSHLDFTTDSVGVLPAKEYLNGTMGIREVADGTCD